MECLSRSCLVLGKEGQGVCEDLRLSIYVFATACDVGLRRLCTEGQNMCVFLMMIMMSRSSFYCRVFKSDVKK